MKTPMQFLLRKIENGDFIHPKIIGKFIKYNLLEKEKEVIENAYDSGQESNWSEDMGLMGDWYYDKTFNNE